MVIPHNSGCFLNWYALSPRPRLSPRGTVKKVAVRKQGDAPLLIAQQVSSPADAMLEDPELVPSAFSVSLKKNVSIRPRPATEEPRVRSVRLRLRLLLTARLPAPRPALAPASRDLTNPKPPQSRGLRMQLRIGVLTRRRSRIKKIQSILCVCPQHNPPTNPGASLHA